METIRNARIVIHLEQGKVELKAPNLAPLLAQQEKHVELIRRLDEETRRLNQTRAASGSGAASVQQAAADLERVSQNAQRATQGLMQAGQGFFRLGRAAVLLGASSDESFAKMIRGLAQVQAYFDLFKGSIQIVMGLQKALAAVQAAQASATVATAAGTAGTTLYARAAGVAAAANVTLVATFGPFLAVLLPVIAAVAALAVAHDLLTTSEAEAAEEAKRFNEIMRERIALTMQNVERERDIGRMRRELMDDPAQRRDAALAEAEKFRGFAEKDLRNADPDFDSATQLDIKRAALAEAMASKAALDEALAAERQRVDDAKEVLDIKIKEIEAQERLVEIAKQAVAIEERKRDTFNAQFGMMNKFEQDETRRIAAKVRANAPLEAWEEEFASTHGGAQSVQEIRARRGAAAGGGDVWAGTADAHKVAESTDALTEVMKKLTELMEAQNAGSPAEAKANLEKAKKDLEKQYEDFYKNHVDAVGKLLDLMAEISTRIKELENVVQRGG